MVLLIVYLFLFIFLINGIIDSLFVFIYIFNFSRFIYKGCLLFTPPPVGGKVLN